MLEDKLVFLIISPNFPECFYKFAEALKTRGVIVLGISDAFPSEIKPHLRNALTEYVQCYDLKNMQNLINTVNYFIGKYGHVDWIESNNEYRLEQDAMLREWFGIRTGIYYSSIAKYKKKSDMKTYFKFANVPFANYHLSDNYESTLDFARKVGFPIFAKPNIGVGAVNSFKINSEEELKEFYIKRNNVEYIFEQFIDGEIYSFDGITNSKGEIIFKDAERFLVNTDQMKTDDTDDAYFVFKDIPQQIDVYGQRIVEAFNIQNRCFHIEFFLLNKDYPGLGNKGEFIALEVNMRSPGGNTPDLISFGTGCSYYDIYADSIVFDENRQEKTLNKSFAISVSRKNRFNYVNSLENIQRIYKDNIKEEGNYDKAIADVMGDTYFMATFDNIEDALSFDKFVRSKL